MNHILITGSNGQLGNEMRLLADRYEDEMDLIFTDREELDITDRQAVRQFIEQHEIDCVVNCAAFTAVDKAESEAASCELINATAPGYLAEAVADRGGNMIQISTDYVFDGTAHIPYQEDEPTCPNSVYGRTKLQGEENVVRLCPGSMIIRTAWLYSSFGHNFVKTMIKLGKEREELGVVADQIGTPTYAHDLAEVVYTALNNGIVPGIYHYTNEGVTSWYDFAKAIHRAAGIDDEDCHIKPLHTEDYPSAAQRPHYSVLDKTKIKQVLGIEIPWWEDSLKNCIKKL